MAVKQYLNDLVSLFFPQTCVGCDKPLAYHERLICTDCWYHLPYTHDHTDANNASARQLWGRVNLEAAASYLYFLDESRVQRIIHHFKYRGCPEIGTIIGLRFGELLKDIHPFDQVDVVVPVPLHSKKIRQRGYNQSEYFAEGLARSMQKPLVAQGIIRCRDTESQTRKNRYERYENLLETFVIDDNLLAGKHVLLVDDVLTTGATIEACATVLLEGGVAKVSAVTIAKAT